MIVFDKLWTVMKEKGVPTCSAYGFSVKDMTESMCATELMKMYQQALTQ